MLDRDLAIGVRLFVCMGALKMREWKMQEWKMQERQSMESHQKILSSTRRNMAVVAFMPTCCQTQLTSELFAFLGHLQHITIGN